MVTLEEVKVGGGRARVWMGGSGEPLLLVHGGWGGAEMHWSRAWEQLALRFRVIAPELPGIGDPAAPGLPSFDAYADWLAELLGALGSRSVWCVGNSFGGVVAILLERRLGASCRGLVVVNGIPPPPPTRLGALLAAWPLRRLVRALYLRLAFSPAVLPRAYADPSLAPPQLSLVLAEPPRALVELLLGVILRGSPRGSPPTAPVLLLWGESDRLPGTGPDAARRLERSLPGARLVVIPSAGHCPQMERPAEFVDALSSFIAAPSAAPRRAAP